MPKLAPRVCVLAEALLHVAAVRALPLEVPSLEELEEHEDVVAVEELPAWARAHLGPQLAGVFLEAA